MVVVVVVEEEEVVVVVLYVVLVVVEGVGDDEGLGSGVVMMLVLQSASDALCIYLHVDYTVPFADNITDLLIIAYTD